MAKSSEGVSETLASFRDATPPLEECPKSPDLSSESSKDDCVSPDGKCAICLGKLENKSFTDSCFHTFCFTCLQEWSKIRPECPLCKQRFTSIIHNVRSNSDYDKYDLDAQQPEPSDNSLVFDYGNFRRFSYHSTLNIDRRYHFNAFQRLAQRQPHYNSQFNWRYRRQVATGEFRRYIYSNYLWVQPSTSGRYRDTSPSFYRSNPACLHRLVPWLNRELNVLLHNHESSVTFVLELILSLLPRFDVHSEEFREHISPFVSLKTPHFIHEFNHFSKSLYDMIAYDQHAVYDDAHREVIELSPNRSEPIRESSVDTITLGSNSSSSTSSNTNEVNKYLNQCEMKAGMVVSKVRQFLIDNDYRGATSSDDSPAQETWDTPTSQPGPSGLQLTSRKRESVWESDSSSENQKKVLRTNDSDDNDPDACIIIDYLKPKRERTPEVITVDSDSSNNGNSTSSKRNQKHKTSKKKSSKKRQKHKKLKS